ncbi:MAG: DUF3303 domain-containing protein [Candidatus Hodarchaeales archaeon]|jgi:hypothetical protein
MQYIAFFEFDPKDYETVVKKWKESSADDERQKNHPKFISKVYSLNEGTKGFVLFETDDPDKIVNYVLYYMPELKFKIQPIIESSKFAEIN